MVDSGAEKTGLTKINANTTKSYIFALVKWLGGGKRVGLAHSASLTCKGTPVNPDETTGTQVRYSERALGQKEGY